MGSRVTVGVDLGGTKVETAVIDDDGKVLASRRHPTNPESGHEAVLDAIVESVRPYAAEYDVRAVGVGVAGQVNRSHGVVRYAPNLRWEDVPLGAELHNALGLPVVVSNDVQAAAWGEFTHGAGKASDNIVCIFVGTGLGGGIVCDGSLLEGDLGAAGELGHLTVVAGGRQCHCPNSGCLEAYVGGWAIAERAMEAVAANPTAGKMMTELAGSPDDITGIIVSQAFHNKDELASRLVKETGFYLGAGLQSVANALNPEMIILGGGIIQGIPELIDMAADYVRHKALKVSTQRLRIRPAALGNSAGVVGAAALARI